MKEGKRERGRIRKMMLSAAASTSIDRGFYDIDRSDVEKSMVETEREIASTIDRGVQIDRIGVEKTFSKRKEKSTARSRKNVRSPKTAMRRFLPVKVERTL